MEGHRIHEGEGMSEILFVKAALQYLGIPYIWGGDDPMRGFDCSGFAQELLAMIGLDPKGDQTAQGLYNHFIKDRSDRTSMCGSLCFYGKSVDKITHVAVFLDEFTVIEAAGGGSKTNTEADAIRHNAYIRIRPWDHRNDVVAIITPKFLPW